MHTRIPPGETRVGPVAHASQLVQVLELVSWQLDSSTEVETSGPSVDELPRRRRQSDDLESITGLPAGIR